MDSTAFRRLFPALDREVYGKRLVYMDNAASSQRPESVCRAVYENSLQHNANLHRAVHALSVEATDAYEKARDAVRDFIGAQCREEVIFTSGATASINLVAYSFGSTLHAGDEIIVGAAEHHSNIVPWQQLSLRNGVVLRFVYPGEDGTYSPDDIESLMTTRTALVCIGHVSNVLGMLNPVQEIAARCRKNGVKLLVDGAQGIVHQLVNIQELGCDFYVFSAHKLFGPTGVGVLWGRRGILDNLPPFLCGGEMVGTVTLEHTTFAPLPQKFEAGTQNFNSVAALPQALEVAGTALTDNELNAELQASAQWLEKELRNIPGLHLYGGSGPRRLPIFSFTVDGCHHEDLALLLDKMGVAVRSGQMCAEPLMSLCGVTGMVRVSLLQYNTLSECEYFVSSLKKAMDMLR